MQRWRISHRALGSVREWVCSTVKNQSSTYIFKEAIPSSIFRFHFVDSFCLFVERSHDGAVTTIMFTCLPICLPACLLGSSKRFKVGIFYSCLDLVNRKATIFTQISYQTVVS